jgi:hypothetical protein
MQTNLHCQSKIIAALGEGSAWKEAQEELLDAGNILFFNLCDGYKGVFTLWSYSKQGVYNLCISPCGIFKSRVFKDKMCIYIIKN